ncbi:Uncharacterised protein [Sphingobacterium spiritivorum]|uniref:Uncharacterized protein n=1 Tax=Sphingobacterium spiritivorum TaxID=258 RepID=A0A380CYD1_SPHSI|nr:Uncharacterised protein [Sphingobacterium spiritivorum]
MKTYVIHTTSSIYVYLKGDIAFHLQSIEKNLSCPPE